MLRLRPAEARDAAEVLALIRELADYERLLDEVDATEDGLRAALFGPAPRVFCDIAEWHGPASGADAGSAGRGAPAVAAAVHPGA